MGIVKERKGFILFLTTIFGNGEPAEEVTNTFNSKEFYNLGNGMADLREASRNVESLEKAYPTSGKGAKDKVNTENVATNINTKTDNEKAPQKEQTVKGREIGE